MSAHPEFQSRTENTTDVWLTPPSLVKSLGHFDLDPCSPIGAPWRLAPLWYTEVEDGLKQPWHGRVFMNPPYGAKTKVWLEKMKRHGNGIALVPSRVETKMFFDHVWGVADAILFPNKRIHFFSNDGAKGKSPNFAAVLIAYGRHNVDALRTCEARGAIIERDGVCLNVLQTTPET